MFSLIGKQRKALIVSLVVLGVLVWNFAVFLPDSKLHIKIYDVGQGDSIFIETPSGFRILVDGGPNNKVMQYLGEDIPFYSKRIDLIVLTHPQADHLTGLIEVIKRYQIKSLWISDVENKTKNYEDWEKVLGEREIPTKTIHSGDRLLIPDGVSLSVISPNKGLHSQDINDFSIVFELSFKNFDVLLTGDADSRVQPFTTSSKHFEVFKVPHHGSRTAVKEEFISKMDPDLSVISSGRENPYGHPNKELIDFLISNGSKVYRTDTVGTVEIVSDGISWYTRTQR